VIERLNRLGVASRSMTSAPGIPRFRTSPLAPADHQDRRSFVSPSKASTRNDTLLEAIVSLGQKLDMTVLVRDRDARTAPAAPALGCELGQGYLFSPAVPAPEVATMLDRRSRRRDRGRYCQPPPTLILQERDENTSVMATPLIGFAEQQISLPPGAVLLPRNPAGVGRTQA